MTLALHIHDLLHWQHGVIQMQHDPERAEYQEHDDQEPKRQRHQVIDVIRSRRDMNEEDQMHAHLCNCKHR